MSAVGTLEVLVNGVDGGVVEVFVAAVTSRVCGGGGMVALSSLFVVMAVGGGFVIGVEWMI